MKIALIGNPNSGKSSLFNLLTGLNQKVGNYPGITVDKKTGSFRDGTGELQSVIDLPGLYSIYPKSKEEEVVFNILGYPRHELHPDLILVVADATNLHRNLFLFTQIQDMGLPCVLILNMVDVANKKGLAIDHEKLSELLGGVPIVRMNARSGSGLAELKSAIESFEKQSPSSFVEGEFTQEGVRIPGLEQQTEFAEKRYRKIAQILRFCMSEGPSRGMSKRHSRVDRIVTHPVYGYLIFMVILFFIFQAIYAWAEWPMDLIDSVFLTLSQWTKTTLPGGILTNLLAEGIIPGLGGVVIFIPQIALLFTFIFILEETGYMARVVFIMDRLMRPFGLNGRSVVPLISGVACAIPAIMSTRTIENWKERLITIMVTPLMSCSARLPVYTLLIALVIPDETIGVFNLKGLVLLGLYFIGLIAALAFALVFKWIIRARQQSHLIMELPLYKKPRWSSLTITIAEKVRLFVWEAGKVIMAISIILWVLASYGPSDRIERAIKRIPIPEMSSEAAQIQYKNDVAAASLANSYIGIMGQSIEPAIRPLGYNWQIGIALITSFAAREVFVGSMATIYSVGEDFEEDVSLLGRMRSEKNEDGTLVYTLASGISLMIFYAFAMQCMSTLAIVYRETKSWKWPMIQLTYMTILAYLAALLSFQLLN